MRVLPRLLSRAYATAATLPGTSPLKQAPLALLPPIPLYRRLLRAHRRHLPGDERVLGDQFLKSEFRAHKSADNPIHIIGFLTEWQLYAQALEGEAWKDGVMDKSKLERMSDEQYVQLYELLKEIQNKSGDADGQGKE